MSKDVFWELVSAFHIFVSSEIKLKPLALFFCLFVCLVWFYFSLVLFCFVLFCFRQGLYVVLTVLELIL